MLILTVLAVSVSEAVAGALALVAVGYLAQVPWVAEHAGWFRSLARSHDAVPTSVGLATSGGLLLMAGAVARQALLAFTAHVCRL